MHDPADRKLKRVKISLLRNDRFAFWRGAMMIGKTELSDTVSTAATDGQNEIYGRALVDMLDEKMLAFVVLHETMHKIGRDLTVWKRLFEDDPELANLACDHRINLLLTDMDPQEQVIAFPRTADKKPAGVLDTRFRGMDVPTIFRLLKQENQNKGGGKSGANPGNPGNPGNFDTHQWGKASERSKEEQDQLDKDIDQALRQGQMEHRRLNGNKEGNLSREFSELLEPKVDWRTVLADFVRSVRSGRDKSSWRRVNRRFLAHDVLMPSLISERVGRLAVGIDTSGSIAGQALNELVTELVALAAEVQPEKVDVMYWDTRVARHEVYDDVNMGLLASTTKPAGGGGTSPQCVKTFMYKENINPECLVILTDGHVDSWPSFDCPTLWVVTTKNITAPSGVTVHLN